MGFWTTPSMSGQAAFPIDVTFPDRGILARCRAAAYHPAVPGTLDPYDRASTAVAGDLPCVTMWLKPNRALSRRGLRRLIVVLAVLALTTAGLGAWQGNVFAPLFALVESAAVACALSVAWRAGDRSERITLDASSLEVQLLPSPALHAIPVVLGACAAGSRAMVVSACCCHRTGVKWRSALFWGAGTRRAVKETHGAAGHDQRPQESAAQVGSTKVQDMTSGGIRRSFTAGRPLHLATLFGGGQPTRTHRRIS
jgi:hypothetical protein